jgi:hypothetical protein
MKKLKENGAKVRVWTSIPQPVKELLAQRALDEHNRESEIIAKAVTMYLTKDVTDESLLIAKMSEIIRVVQNMNTKLDTGQKLDLEFYQYFFMFAPDFPGDEKEQQRVFTKGAGRTQSFLSGFRQREKQMPRLLEAIFGMMLEEEKE